jgi:SAM-dependent methyltransferase
MEPDREPKANSASAGAKTAYQAYLLRLWQEHRTGQPVWRASLENPHTGERLGFAGLPLLFAHLQKMAGSPAPAQLPATGGNSAMGNAVAQGQLWGSRARDWAEIQEGQVLPLFEAALDRIGAGPGRRVLDVGCGAGRFCQMAAQRGAEVAGLDASEAMIEIARERAPDGDFRIGEMEELPFGDNEFDAVTGFNSFQYAASPVKALREARRVVRSGGAVLIAVWGQAADLQALPYLAAVGSLLPAPPPGTPGPLALSEPGALEALAEQAGLKPGQLEEVETLWTYADEAEARRGFLSSGPAIRAIELAGEQAVWAAVSQAIAPLRTPSGGCMMRNKFRFLVGQA